MERRTSARSPVFMLVKNRDARDPMWAWDIGLGGMQCRAQRARWPGTYLDLAFRLPQSADVIEVGGQVMTLTEAPQGLSLGVRFCMISARAQMALYRFLDRRRHIWTGETAKQDAAAYYRARAAATERPFESLLLEAYASLRARELRPTGFIRAPSFAAQPA